VGVSTDTDVVSEVARLRASIDRVAAATEIRLAGLPPRSEDEDRPLMLEREELRRQLAALRERVVLAEQVNENSRALRAELATLLFFARTLQADAAEWHSRLDKRIQEVARQIALELREQERLAAEREKLMPLRDALRLRVVQAAEGMAARYGGECRRTVPVVPLEYGLGVCSVTVSCPRRGLRSPKRWLVTLDESRDGVRVIRDY
jgi:hypothetical protein